MILKLKIIIFMKMCFYEKGGNDENKKIKGFSDFDVFGSQNTYWIIILIGVYANGWILWNFLNFLTFSEENEIKLIDNPNYKVLYDIANFYRFNEQHEKAVSFYTQVSTTGNTSITIDIETFVTRKNDQLEKNQDIKVTEGKFVYVSIDLNGKPIPIR